MENSKIKKSVVLSGLVTTGGLFVAKLIGLLYAIPFSYLLSSDAFSAIYGGAYAIYNYLLNVFTAGIPFAISSLVAKYSVTGNARTVIKIRKISLRLLMLFGLCGMLVMMLIAPFAAPLMISGSQNVPIMRNVLWLLALAIFLVPILSAYRGVVQGRKEMGEYAFSQAFEQIFRVGFLLSVALLVIYVFKMDRVWALYGAVLSTSVAAIAGIAQVIHFSNKHMKSLDQEASAQKTKSVKSKIIQRELFALAIPYLAVAVLGYSDDIYNSVLLPIGLRMHDYTSAQVHTITSAFNFSGTKLKAIPLILAPGFTAALIPHISGALAARDQKLVRKNVTDCLNIVGFLAMPISFCIFVYAAPICNTLFYTDDLTMAAMVTQWIALEGFLGTVQPVISNLLMVLQMRRFALQTLLASTIIKGVLMVPMTMWLGFPGAIIASCLGNLAVIGGGLWMIEKKFQIPMLYFGQLLGLTAVATAGLWVTSQALSILGLSGLNGSTLQCFLEMAANGVISVLVFLGIAFFLGLPQQVFHLNLDQLLGPKDKGTK